MKAKEAAKQIEENRSRNNQIIPDVENKHTDQQMLRTLMVTEFTDQCERRFHTRVLDVKKAADVMTTITPWGKKICELAGMNVIEAKNATTHIFNMMNFAARVYSSNKEKGISNE